MEGCPSIWRDVRVRFLDQNEVNPRIDTKFGPRNDTKTYWKEISCLEAVKTQKDTTGLPRGVSRSLQRERLQTFWMPRACPGESHFGGYRVRAAE
jgi:hypothetical protein